MWILTTANILYKVVRRVFTQVQQFINVSTRFYPQLCLLSCVMFIYLLIRNSDHIVFSIMYSYTFSGMYWQAVMLIMQFVSLNKVKNITSCNRNILFVCFSNGDVTITGEGLQILTFSLHSRPLSIEGFQRATLTVTRDIRLYGHFRGIAGCLIRELSFFTEPQSPAFE